MIILRLKISLGIVNTRIVGNIYTLLQIAVLALRQVLLLVGLVFQAVNVRALPRFLVDVLVDVSLCLVLDFSLEMG